MQMKKIWIFVVGYLIPTLIIVWLGASFIDTMTHNLNDYDYSFWNAFELFYEKKNE